MTKNELRAKLLIEAAELLNEGAATKARKEIIGDIKIQKQADLYKKFKNAKMEYDEAKKYYATIKKEIISLRHKIEQIPAETSFEKLKMMLGPHIPGAVLCGAIAYMVAARMRFTRPAMAVMSPIAVIAFLAGNVGADSLLSAVQGKAFNWNEDKALEKLGKFERQVDKTMERYEEMHDDEISSKNESIDLFI